MKRHFYKTKLDKKFRLLIGLFLLISIVMFAIVLFDSFVYGLPFHYILFFFAGLILSRLFKKVQKIEWDKKNEAVIRTMNIQGVVLLIILILARTFLLPKAIGSLNINFISDAVLLVVMGTFLGRVFYFIREIDRFVFEYFLRSNK